MLPNHYATLGVAPDSDDVVIRAAFKALMLKYHPDTNKSVDATKRAAALNAAFAVVGDPQRRAAYDAQRKASRAGPPPPPASPPAPPKPTPPPKNHVTANSAAPAEKSRWAQVGGWIAGVVVLALIRVGI